LSGRYVNRPAAALRAEKCECSLWAKASSTHRRAGTPLTAASPPPAPAAREEVLWQARRHHWATQDHAQALCGPAAGESAFFIPARGALACALHTSWVGMAGQKAAPVTTTPGGCPLSTAASAVACSRWPPSAPLSCCRTPPAAYSPPSRPRFPLAAQAEAPAQPDPDRGARRCP